MNIIEIEIGKLLPYEKNAKKHPKEQVAKIAASIKRFGFQQPLVVDKDNVVIIGHGRLEAAKKLKYETVPCTIADNLSNDEIIALRLAYNKLNESEWDMELVNMELEGLDTELKELTGFEAMEVLDAQDDDFDTTPPEDPKSKLGDLYQLGEHRLLCGDATKIEDVERLMDGENADIAFTSPPYNAGDNIRGKFYENDGDDKSDDEYTSFLTVCSMNMIEVSQFAFVNLGILESNKIALIDYQTQMRNFTKDILIWNKSIAPPHINPGTFGTKWEYVFALSKDAKSRAFPCNWQGKFYNVIETQNNSGNEFAKEHRAGFPVAFPAWIIEKMDFAKTVLDVFGGTGTTLIACEQLKRRCRMMELDPRYVDVIVARWEKLTGKNAELIT